MDYIFFYMFFDVYYNRMKLIRASQENLTVVFRLRKENVDWHSKNFKEFPFVNISTFDKLKELTLLALKNQDECFIYLIKRRSIIVGMIYFVVNNAESTILDLYVSVDYRSKGVGRMLIDSIVFKPINVNVWHENKLAIKFYESNEIKPNIKNIV